MALPQFQEETQDPIAAERTRLREVTQKIPVIIGVHSGKGGVGKTFVATQIALLLSDKGLRVGLLDADVDCPNVPQSLGLEGSLEVTESGKLTPITYRGVQVVSTQFMSAGDEPIIVRGPIKHKLLTDLLEKTAWDSLDVLLIDFPPGTSDVPLSAMQVAGLTGVIVVVAPHSSGVGDATKAVNMAKQLGVPVLGLVENMSGSVFGEGRGIALSKEVGVPLICSIPLSQNIREKAEKGDIAVSGTIANALMDLV